MSKIYDELKQAEADRASSRKALICAGLHIKGQISGNEDLDVEGKVEGPVQLGEGKLTLGAGGNLIGDLAARDAIIHGALIGNLQISGCLEIKSDGSVVGNVVTDRIIVEDGAQFKGSIKIRRKIPQSGAAKAVSA